jgi:putative tricarboxylic transport membrane protein
MKGDVIGGVLGIAIGIAVVAGASALGVGGPLDPRPGFFPLLGGIGVIALSSTLLVQALLGRSTGGESFGDVRRSAILIGGLAVYVAILEPAGYVVATAFIAAVLLRVLGVTSWRRVAAGSVVLPIGTWLLFARLLGVELPAGRLSPFE